MSEYDYPEIEKCFQNCDVQEMLEIAERLALDGELVAFGILEKLVTSVYAPGVEGIIISEILCRVLIKKGVEGLKVLEKGVRQGEMFKMRKAAFEALWNAARKLNAPPMLLLDETILPLALESESPAGLDDLASKIIDQLIIDSRRDASLFRLLGHFMTTKSILMHEELECLLGFQGEVFEKFAEATVVLSRSLLNQFENLLDDGKLREEDYHIFLRENPVFIDPSAFRVISKQRLGVEYATDFAIQTLNSQWVLVEIESPQNPIFTKNRDFANRFIHGFGQVLDFLEWVSRNNAYASTLMPGINEPKGLLIIGRSNNLAENELNKLSRLRKQLWNLDILTYDDLLTKARLFYQNFLKG